MTSLMHLWSFYLPNVLLQTVEAVMMEGMQAVHLMALQCSACIGNHTTVHAWFQVAGETFWKNEEAAC
jgi:hypothetical protein